MRRQRKDGRGDGFQFLGRGMAGADGPDMGLAALSDQYFVRPDHDLAAGHRKAHLSRQRLLVPFPRANEKANEVLRNELEIVGIALIPESLQVPSLFKTGVQLCYRRRCRWVAGEPVDDGSHSPMHLHERCFRSPTPGSRQAVGGRS